MEKLNLALRDRCLALAGEMADEINGDIDRVDPDDLEDALSGLTEFNLVAKAAALAGMAAWAN